MKALTVRQPYAWAIVAGIKPIENRSRPTKHRGPLAILAGKSRSEFSNGQDHASVMPGLPDPDGLAYGAIIGVVDVVDCLPYDQAKDRPFAEPDGYCWVLANPRTIEPIPMIGRLGLFEVDLPEEPSQLGLVDQSTPVEPSARATEGVDGGNPLLAEVDPDLAELRAFRARYRAGGFPEPDVEAKKRARAELVARGISPKWSSFVARFGFSGEIAYAMLRTLESPGRCHAGWFKEGEIAVRRAGLDLSTLNYEAIRGAIEAWRAERKGGISTEG